MKMKKIVFATNNAHKLDEVRAILGEEYCVLGLHDIGCDEDIPETSDTLDGNAEIKARFVKDKYGYDCFADDTGLEVEVLDGAPGVYSARYAGPGHDSEANMTLLLHNMKGKDNRNARFRTVICLIEGSSMKKFEGIVNGTIIEKRKGNNGFGYDPVFVPEGFDRTFAELTPEEKNGISHRGRAVVRLSEYFHNKD